MHLHVKGYLYVMYHETFQQYVDEYVSSANVEREVYKLGWTVDPEGRMRDYTTSFLTPCKFLYVSQLFDDGYRAERILFYLLRRERLNKHREFFNVSCERVIAIIKRLERLQHEMAFSRLYAMMCLQCIPFKILTQLSQLDEAAEYIDRLVPKEFDQSCSINDYLEQFRYRPKDLTFARERGFLFPEESDIQMLVRNATEHTRDTIFHRRSSADDTMDDLSADMDALSISDI